MSKLLDYLGLQQFLAKLKTLFVTGLGTSGNYLTWTKNGETSNITVPYATEADKLSVTSTDDAVVRFDGTSGAVQNSGVTINDNNHITATKFITSGGTSTQFVKGDGSLDDGIYMTTNTFSGDSDKIYIPYIMNGLYAAHRRFTVTAVVTNADSTQTTWSSSYYSQLFDGSYETSGLRIPAGGSLKVTITNGDIDTTSITTYKAGYFLVSFYNTQTPLSVTGRIYTGNPDGTKSWSNITFTKTRGTYNGTYISSELTGNYLRALEITITSKSDSSAWVSEIEYWKKRPSSISDYPIITKFAGGELYGNLTAPKFITKDGTSNKFVKGDGSLDSTSYAPLASPSLTGTPTAPTAAAGTNTTQIATTAFVHNVCDALKVSIINHGTSDTTFALTPNVYHKWESVSTLTLTLATPSDNTVLNEYMFSFVSPSTPTTLSLPASVNWAIDLQIEPNKTYQITIIDDLATFVTVDMLNIIT